VFRLPANLFAEETGSFTNSGRVIQWHWKAADGPGESKGDIEIMAALFLKLKAMYAKDGGKLPEPILNLTWPYRIPAKPSPAELLMEISGKALADVFDPEGQDQGAGQGRRAGGRLRAVARRRLDLLRQLDLQRLLVAGGQPHGAARQLRSVRPGPDAELWGFAWPANRRILYNRASCDISGKPWDPKRTVIKWTGTAWGGNDVPDMRPDAAPDENVMPFIMTPEGVARLFAPAMADGPFPEHYEPFETPLDKNPFHPGNPKATSNPAARVFKGDMETFGKAKDFPYVATTYRLVEHFHYWTKHSMINAVLQPDQFVEISEELAQEKGIATGDKVKVRSNRGFIKAVAVVTKRIKTLDVDGKKVHTVGIPIHWGFKGVTKPGFITNTLTPFVGDANCQTPEYKAFLVNIEKI
jgi:anaerobic selenocysteine-containing dehydrogenase